MTTRGPRLDASVRVRCVLTSSRHIQTSVTPLGNSMPRIAAGLVMYRIREGHIEVLLAHPGGPLFKKKDAGAWTIPKGEPDDGEDLLPTAQREFTEETGLVAQEPFLPLGSIQQKGGKIVHAWAFEGDCDPATLRSNQFTMEWPPKSGQHQQFPEIDRADFFTLKRAREKLRAEQVPLVEELADLLKRRPPSPPG
jgi:predicted NUDIX family NTP pyrophosphohydrolase